jgi:hypothetical protein
LLIVLFGTSISFSYNRVSSETGHRKVDMSLIGRFSFKRIVGW